MWEVWGGHAHFNDSSPCCLNVILLLIHGVIFCLLGVHGYDLGKCGAAVIRSCHLLFQESLCMLTVSPDRGTVCSVFPHCLTGNKETLFVTCALGKFEHLLQTYLDKTNWFCNSSPQSLNLIKLPTITILFLEALWIFVTSLYKLSHAQFNSLLTVCLPNLCCVFFECFFSILAFLLKVLASTPLAFHRCFWKCRCLSYVREYSFLRKEENVP